MKNTALSSDISRARAVTDTQRQRMQSVADAARRQREEEEAETRRLQEEQTSREQKLDGYLDQAMQGASAIAALLENPEMKELLKARAQIKKGLLLYLAKRDGGSAWVALMEGDREGYVWGCRSPRDEEIQVRIGLEEEGVNLSFSTHYHGYFGADGRSADRDRYCHWEYQVLPGFHEETKEGFIYGILYSWLRGIALTRLSAPRTGDNWKIERERFPPVSDEILETIRSASARVAAEKNQMRYEWQANILFLRFLMDCANPKKLRKYLERALNDLAESESA